MATPERGLGYWATVQALHHRHAGSGALVQVVRIRGPLRADALRTALDRAQRRHPRLRTDLVEQRRHTVMDVADPGAGPRPALEHAPPTTPLALAEAELALPLPPPPHWRAVLASHSCGTVHDLALVFHHGLADGRSVLRLTDELLSDCGRLREGDEQLPPVEPLPFAPAIETHLPRDRAGARRTSSPGEEPSTQPEGRWRRQGDAPLEERRTHLIPVALEAKRTQALAERCRAESTSVHSALMAALLRACAEPLGASGALPLTSPVDLTRFADPPLPEGSFGCFIGLLTTRHPVDPSEPFWATARACAVTLREALATQRAQGFAPRRFTRPLLQLMIDQKLQRAEDEQVFPDGVSLSNMGRVPLPPSWGPLTLDGFLMSAPQPAGLFPIFWVTATLHGALQGSLAWVEPLLGRATAEAIATAVHEQLRAALS